MMVFNALAFEFFSSSSFFVRFLAALGIVSTVKRMPDFTCKILRIFAVAVVVAVALVVVVSH